MSSTIKMEENSLASIAFDIPKEEFAGALEKAFRKNIKSFSIPGFRPGKAPMNLVTKYYGEAVLYDDAIEYIAEEAYTKAIEEHSLSPVSRPQIDEITEIGADKGIKFTIKVTLKPEVTLGEYKGLEVSREKVKITGEKVQEELDKVRERNARMIPVEDRAVLNGDTANIDYEGLLDEVPFEGGTGASYDLRIGSNTFIPGFEEQVIGRNVGEEFDVNVTFPEDYQSEDLKGKAVVFKVKVNSISTKELPVADDEFAKDVSEFDTLDEYMNDLKEKLEKDANEAADSEFENKLVEMIVENATVEVPDAMIEGQIDQTIDEQSNRMRYQGIEIEQYLQYMGQDMETFRESLREGAQKQVKTNLVMEALGKKLDFEVTKEEIEEEILRISKLYNMEPDTIKEQFQGNDDLIKEGIVGQKTIDYLKENAKSTKAKPKEKKVKTEEVKKED